MFSKITRVPNFYSQQLSYLKNSKIKNVLKKQLPRVNSCNLGLMPSFSIPNTRAFRAARPDFSKSERPLVCPARLFTMHESVLQGDFALVKKNFNTKEDLNCADSFGYSALHKAVLCRHFEVAKWLLEQGADVDAVTEQGLSSLHMAAYTNNLDMVILLISKDININLKNKQGLTALALATARRNKVIMRFLLSSGAIMPRPEEFAAINQALQSSSFWPHINKSDFSRPNV